MQQNATVANMT